MPCVLAVIVGVCVSVASAGLIVQRDNQDARLQFGITAANHFMVLQNGLDEYVNRLHAVRALFASSEEAVTRGVFDAFTQPLLVEDAAIVTLSWVPLVLNSGRAEHERAAVRQGLVGYRIKAMQADGTMIASPERSEYYPIFYATVPKTSPLYGLDLRSEPEALLQLEKARDTDRLGFSKRDTLVTTGGTDSGFLFSLPVYKSNSPHGSVEDRRRNLVGFVHGSLNTGRLFNTIMIEIPTPKGIDTFFFAPDAGPDDPPLYVHSSRLRDKPVEPMTQAALARAMH
ncbi:MAG TPA: CHASE domain-containing protein, partial [Xanthobacteraceae bacterium]|nr:CHASE domain-containing protein [Xanthobacteraceae bacterium]